MSLTTEELEDALLKAGEKLRMQEMMNEMFEEKFETLNRLNKEAIEAISASIMHNTAFLRKIRDWTVSSIDTGDIRDRVLDAIDFTVLAELLMSDEPYGLSAKFHQAILSNTRFRAVVDHCVQSTLNSYNMQDTIDETIRVSTANVGNEAAEKAMKIIAERILKGADV